MLDTKDSLKNAEDNKEDGMIKHNYLTQQFEYSECIIDDIRAVVRKGDFTLGEQVESFENNVRLMLGSRFAVGVNSGTDALFLSLKAVGVGSGDEVITSPYTFYATVGAIVATGARPVFVDIGEDYNIDPSLIEKAITVKTRAIIPVHWAGLPCIMDEVMMIAAKKRLHVIEDSCQAVMSRYNGKAAGTFGVTGCFSMHPLKNLNAWGDAGFIVTDDEEIYSRLIQLRNHGLEDRDKCVRFGYNSSLDSIQAVVANHVLLELSRITQARRLNAGYLDKGLKNIKQVTVPHRSTNAEHVYHLYVIQAEQRDNLQRYLVENGIDAKVHYPTPMHLQPAARPLGYSPGDFPVCEATCKSVLSLPVHEFITGEDVMRMAGLVSDFYAQIPAAQEMAVK